MGTSKLPRWSWEIDRFQSQTPTFRTAPALVFATKNKAAITVIYWCSGTNTISAAWFSFDAAILKKKRVRAYVNNSFG